jgi:alkanesulfonate monooxygenase SsuD/methylene tetrahydromethanopterin reductase-like flavin-dependent oxidoreductase (luciferase family)
MVHLPSKPRAFPRWPAALPEWVKRHFGLQKDRAIPVPLQLNCTVLAAIDAICRVLRLIRGESLELLPPVDSMEPLWSDIEKAAVENRLGAAIVGSDATVQVGLEKLVNDTHADEVIVVTDTYEHSDRMDSYERVARIAAEIKLVPNVERRFK